MKDDEIKGMKIGLLLAIEFIQLTGKHSIAKNLYEEHLKDYEPRSLRMIASSGNCKIDWNELM